MDIAPEGIASSTEGSPELAQVHVGEVLLVLEHRAPRVVLFGLGCSTLGSLCPLSLHVGPTLGTALGCLEGGPAVLPVDDIAAGGAVHFLDHLGGCGGRWTTKVFETGKLNVSSSVAQFISSFRFL